RGVGGDGPHDHRLRRHGEGRERRGRAGGHRLARRGQLGPPGRHRPAGGNWSSDGHVAVDASGNYAWAPGKTVALVGVEGLVVVDTPDALLIASKERSEEVKEVVDRLRREEREDLL